MNPVGNHGRWSALALIVTAHPGVDHRAITERAQLTLDLRGVTRGLGAAALQL